MLMSFGGSGKEMGKLGRDNYGKNNYWCNYLDIPFKQMEI